MYSMLRGPEGGGLATEADTWRLRVERVVVEGGRAKQSARREAEHDAERLKRLRRPTRAHELRE